MNLIYIFHFPETFGNEAVMLPSYYVDGEYDKVAIRLHANTAPLRDAKFNIYDDGVSILVSDVILPAGQNSDEIAEEFNSTPIEEGSWVSCNLVDAGGGKNFTVQLELHQVSEDETGEG